VAETSQMVEIIRRLGEASAAPIHLRKLLLSSEQEFFGFIAPRHRREISAEVFDLLGRAAVNIRLISQYLTDGGDLCVRLCVDGCSGPAAREVFREETVRGAVQRFEHLQDARVLSLYPFNGRPEVVERVFTELRKREIRILAANSATSVISCVVSGAQAEEAVDHLKRVIIFQ
jgi:aspartokinase